MNPKSLKRIVQAIKLIKFTNKDWTGSPDFLYIYKVDRTGSSDFIILVNFKELNVLSQTFRAPCFNH